MLLVSHDSWHRTPTHLDPMCVVNQPVEDAIGQRGIADVVVLPFRIPEHRSRWTSVFHPPASYLFSQTYRLVVRLPEQINRSVREHPVSPYTPTMDLHRILSELHAERDRIDHAIAAMERLVRVQRGNRRGRLPKSLRLLELKGPRLVVKRKRAEACRKSKVQMYQMRCARFHKPTATSSICIGKSLSSILYCGVLSRPLLAISCFSS